MSRFIEEVLKIMNTQLNRIHTCLNKLSEDDIWNKVKSNTNSIGNIRERSLEFSASNILSKEELIKKLRLVRHESTAVL